MKPQKTGCKNSQPPDRKKYPRVVILDDENSIVQLCAAVIRRVHPEAEIIRYADGEEAWNELTQRDPDLFMLDEYHPGLRGLEIIQRLAERKAEFPMIFMTVMGNTREKLDAWFEENTAKLFERHPLKVKLLEKPFEVEEMLATVKELLGPATISPPSR